MEVVYGLFFLSVILTYLQMKRMVLVSFFTISVSGRIPPFSLIHVFISPLDLISRNL